MVGVPLRELYLLDDDIGPLVAGGQLERAPV